MNAAFRARIFLSGPSDTSEFGRKLAPLLTGGDTVLLVGDMGVGKSHLCRAIIQARTGEATEVPSPTYTLVQTYENGGVEIWHADLYRISDLSEIVELGLEEAFDHQITLVEWADRLGDVAPSDALKFEFSERDGGRVVSALGSARWLKIRDVFDA